MLVTPVRHLWAGRIDLGRVGMAVALPVLAWVFYTTSSGMIDIMQKEPGDLVGIVGTLVATSAILIMLASTSWSLGTDLAALIAHRRMARERMIIKTLVTALVFAFVFSISAFFSFTYYYNNIFKLSSRKIVAELQPNELAAEVMLPAAKQLAAAARQEEQLAVDAAHGLDNKGAVCGPNCWGHRAKAQEALQRLAAIRRTLAGPTAERANALKKRDALVALLIPLKQKAEAADNGPGQTGGSRS